MGRKEIGYSIEFQCPKPGCTIRHPLDVCNNNTEYMHCGKHDIDLNDIRELFGK